MPPSLALFIWFVLLALLLRYDPAKVPGTSWALWLPVIWISIVASRLPSQWLGGQLGTVAGTLEEGNAIDRTIWLILLVLAIAVLISRSFNWADFVARNLALTAYISFALMSVIWSDFAFVAFKRWFRDLGSYFMILIVLSDPDPVEAVRTFLRRVCYLLIPLSVIVIKYFINIGRAYDKWSGLQMFVGVTTGKNLLGVLCLVSGLFFLWDTIVRWPHRKESQTKRVLLVNLGFGLMTLYCLRLAHSMTAFVCLGIACAVITAAYSGWGRRHPVFLKAMIPTAFCLYLILGFGLGLNALFAQMLGKDPTLTDRTHIWSVLLGMHTNPLVGTGYESFWLGSRLDLIFDKAGEHIDEAHDGYLEVYLNLGSTGLLLLVAFLVTGYANICRQDIRSRTNFASLVLAFWAVAVMYNISEAGFKHGLMWLSLLLGAINLAPQEDQIQDETLVPSAPPIAPDQDMGGLPISDDSFSWN